MITVKILEKNHLAKFGINLFNYLMYDETHSYFLMYDETHSCFAFQEETERLLNEHNEFKSVAKETRERVKLLIQLADSIVEKGHTHASTIRHWVQAVDKGYKDFSVRMDKYR